MKEKRNRNKFTDKQENEKNCCLKSLLKNSEIEN